LEHNRAVLFQQQVSTLNLLRRRFGVHSDGKRPLLQLGSSRAGIGNRRGRYDQVWIWFARGRRFAERRDKPFRPHLGEAPQDRDRLQQTRRHRHPCSKARRCTVVSSFIREMRSFARQSDAGRIIAFRNRLIYAYAAVSNESSGHCRGLFTKGAR